jgi:hypothetical protein
MPKAPKKRFAAFVDADDSDDDEVSHGGGVLLRDFEDDCPFGSSSTPFGTNNTTSSGKTSRSTDPQTRATTVSAGTSTTAPRRNTIQPIGTGRYGVRTTEAQGGAPLGTSSNAYINPWVCIGRLAMLLLS